jgi:fucose permease
VIKSNKRSFVTMLLIVYATMLLFGVIENIKGVSFPLIKAAFGATYDAQGGLVSFSWYGYVCFCLVAALALQRFGSRRSLLLGYLLVGLGCVAVLFAPSFLTVTLALMVLWMGFGFFEVGTNALATRAFAGKNAAYMSLMHFFYGLGAVLGPRLAGVLVTSFKADFRGVYLAALVPVVVVTLLVAFSRAGNHAGGESEHPTLTIAGALRSPYVWLLASSLGFMEVIEFGAANWGGLYLKDVFGLNPATAGAAFVSAYYIFFTLSRLVSGFGVERIGYARSMVLGLLGLLLLYGLGFSLGRNGLWLLPLTGFFAAIMWPTLMCLAMRIFRADAPIATSVIIVISGAINGILQFGTGLINEHIGQEWGYRFSVLYVLAALALISYIAHRCRIRQAAAEGARGMAADLPEL